MITDKNYCRGCKNNEGIGKYLDESKTRIAWFCTKTHEYEYREFGKCLLHRSKCKSCDADGYGAFTCNECAHYDDYMR